MNDALYTTLQVFAKSLGKRQVTEICQRFILDCMPTEIEEPLPVMKKKFTLIKKKKSEPKPEPKPEEKVELKEPLLIPKSDSVKKTTPTLLTNRNFKKMAQETHFLPIGTLIITSDTDINPAIYGTVVRTPMGAPAIQPSWDKTKFFTGTSSPPAMFLKEISKSFKNLSTKTIDTGNAWNAVYKRNLDGTNISLADLWKQTII